MTKRVCLVASLLAAVLVFPARSSHAASAGSTDGVVSVLLKKYTLTTATAMGGAQITHEGNQLSLKQAGVYSYPANGVYSKMENQVKDGKIKGPTGASFSCKSFHCHVLQAGEKVYVTKIESKTDSGDDILKFTVISADNIDGGDGAERYGTVVTFKFKKGYLSESSPEDVEGAIEAVMAPGDDADSGKKDDTASQPAAAQPAAPVQRAAAPVQCAVAPTKPAGPLPPLSIGERWSEVLTAYGMPVEIIDLGKKVTFKYKDTKVIFTDGKISDMQ